MKSLSDRPGFDKMLVSLKASCGRLMSIVTLLDKPEILLKALQSISLIVIQIYTYIPESDKLDPIRTSHNLMKLRQVLITANESLSKSKFTSIYGPEPAVQLQQSLFEIEELLWMVVVPNKLITVNAAYFDALGHIAVSKDDEGGLQIRSDINAEEEFNKTSSELFRIRE